MNVSEGERRCKMTGYRMRDARNRMEDPKISFSSIHSTLERYY